jgi:hypothetical protein
MKKSRLAGVNARVAPERRCELGLPLAEAELHMAARLRRSVFILNRAVA